jgi:hypothetical protein
VSDCTPTEWPMSDARCTAVRLSQDWPNGQ